MNESDGDGTIRGATITGRFNFFEAVITNYLKVTVTGLIFWTG